MTPSEHPPPIAIGGVGGSGTRLIASILQNLGFYMGQDISSANDNLAFTLLFKRRELWPVETHIEEIRSAWQLFLKVMHHDAPWSLAETTQFHELSTNDRLQQHPKEWLAERADRIINTSSSSAQPGIPWGWKEPNTHIVLPVLSQLSPNMKYIHVMRHGIDMAYSANQWQLQFWGKLLLNESELELNPENSLRYWCESHRRIIKYGKQLGSNFLLLNYDRLCQDPKNEVPPLLEFLGKNTIQNMEKISPLISPPRSIGRYKEQEAVPISQRDVDFLSSLGYET
jgi:hypothetical protein